VPVDGSRRCAQVGLVSTAIGTRTNIGVVDERIPDRDPSATRAKARPAHLARYARRMVTVRVDVDLCVGHGRCYVLAPDVFGTDEFGHCVVLEEQVANSLAADARNGADNCPEQAITVE